MSNAFLCLFVTKVYATKLLVTKFLSLEDTLRLYLCNICNNTLIPLVSRGFGIIWILAFDIKIGLKYKTYFIFMVYQPEVLKNTNYFIQSIWRFMRKGTQFLDQTMFPWEYRGTSTSPPSISVRRSHRFKWPVKYQKLRNIINSIAFMIKHCHLYQFRCHYSTYFHITRWWYEYPQRRI